MITVTFFGATMGSLAWARVAFSVTVEFPLVPFGAVMPIDPPVAVDPDIVKAIV